MGFSDGINVKRLANNIMLKKIQILGKLLLNFSQKSFVIYLITIFIYVVILFFLNGVFFKIGFRFLHGNNFMYWFKKIYDFKLLWK